MEQIVDRFLEEKDKQKQTDIYLNEVFKLGLHKEFHKEIVKTLNLIDHNNKKYYYLITFTIDKTKYQVLDKIIEKYIISRLQRPALQVEKAHIVKELTQQGTAHWHASVIAKKYISKSRFKYYINKYGFVDISKNHSQKYETMIKYITKSNTAKQIVGGLLDQLDQ